MSARKKQNYISAKQLNALSRATASRVKRRSDQLKRGNQTGSIRDLESALDLAAITSKLMCLHDDFFLDVAGKCGHLVTDSGFQDALAGTLYKYKQMIRTEGHGDLLDQAIWVVSAQSSMIRETVSDIEDRREARREARILAGDPSGSQQDLFPF